MCLQRTKNPPQEHRHSDLSATTSHYMSCFPPFVSIETRPSRTLRQRFCRYLPYDATFQVDLVLLRPTTGSYVCLYCTPIWCWCLCNHYNIAMLARTSHGGTHYTKWKCNQLILSRNILWAMIKSDCLIGPGSFYPKLLIQRQPRSIGRFQTKSNLSKATILPSYPVTSLKSSTSSRTQKTWDFD